MALLKLQTCVFLALITLGGSYIARSDANAEREDTDLMSASFEDDSFFPYTSCFADEPIVGSKNIMLDETKRWPKGVIPYVIDSTVDQTKYLSVIKQGMKKITSKSCLTFVERTNEENYVRIKDVQGGGCRSSVGMVGKEQILNLESGGCMNDVTIPHELLHAAGFWHEQQRRDRDEYITVNFTNIYKAFWRDFDLCDECSPLGQPYDYHSIMHYSAKSFAIDKNYLSMWSKDPNNPIPENRRPGLEKLTRYDIAKIQIMYNNCE